MTPITRTLLVIVSFGVLDVSFHGRAAFADPPPWAPAHGYRGHHHDDDDDDNDWWKHHDRDEWKHRHGHHHGDDARCGEILDRMSFDRGKVREIEPTGRHRKALQWYRDDMDNARKDLDRCRHGG